ncbi:MAG: hypothetical protein EOO61_06190 [Hymenobacter sp.]|nr:MAG: hypothetical protein EOO61_06190 [Hymenobacter sp.]
MFTVIMRPIGPLPPNLGLEILGDPVWQQDYPDYLQAWVVAEEFLLDEGWVYKLPTKSTPETAGSGLAAPGATEPTCFYGADKIITEFMEIEIVRTPTV